MKKLASIDFIRRFFLIMLTFLLPISAYSYIEININLEIEVNELLKLELPDPYRGYIDYIHWANNTNKVKPYNPFDNNLAVAWVIADEYFEGTATVECIYTAVYSTPRGGTAADSYLCTFHITCKAPKKKQLKLTITPNGGSVKKGSSISIEASVNNKKIENASIYYTIDGAKPSISSNRYYKPITINESKTIKAIAYHADYLTSDVKSAKFVVGDHYDYETITKKTVEGVEMSFFFMSESSGSYSLTVGNPDRGTPSIDSKYTGNITIPSSIDGYPVKSIGDYAFYNCKISSVSIPNDVEKIGTSSFSYCKNLASITIPSKVRRINSWSFSSSGLTSIIIPEGVNSINEEAFYDCDNMTSITLPSTISSVTNSIGDWAFASCDKLEKIISYITNPPIIDEETFRGAYYSANLYVPKGTKNTYKSKKGWGFPNVYEMGDNKEKIELSASPSGGEVSKGTIVYLRSSNAPDADIYYTMDGSKPTKNSTKYTSSGIAINATCTLMAIAYKNGYDDSDILKEKYTVENKIYINEINFPDEYFCKFLLSQGYGADGVLTEREINNLKSLICFSEGIKNLKGIEYFTSLEKLYCSLNSVKSLDLSKNTKLRTLECAHCGLTTLDLSHNTALEFLDCSLNNIKGAGMDNLINSLPVTVNGVFRVTRGSDNICTKTQVAAAKAKGWIPYYYDGVNNGKEIWLEYGGVEQNIIIDATNFPDDNFRKYLLEQDYGKDGVITEEELIYAWRIDVHNKSISNLKGIELLSELYYLDCGYNQLKSIDLSKNTKLEILYAGNNQLSTLDISNNVLLRYLHCYENLLVDLDVSKNPALTDLACGYNQLTSLNVSKNINLKDLSCYGNKLSSLDVSKNTELELLSCFDNMLASLDLSKNTKLKELYFYQNKIEGVAMDKLISSLPIRNTNDGIFYVIISSSKEKNVCTTKQVAEAKKRGWTPYQYIKSWVEYEGSDPSSIDGVLLDKTIEVPIYNLNGQRLYKPRKGIIIIGGKKVLVK